MSPIRAVKKITAWSYSRWQTYEKCPRLAEIKFIKKLREPKAPAMQRGIDIHNQAEQYVTSELKRIPKALRLFAEEFKGLRESCRGGGVLVEQEWAYTKGWKSTSWFGSDAWLRVKCDAVCDETYNKDGVIIVIDHKTGKVREENKAQLELYALGALLKYPKAKLIRTQFWYLDEGVLTEEQFTRADLPELKKRWKVMTKAMLSDTLFPPRSNYSCKWCHWGQGNGGPCEY